ncbi:siphovirus Gp157 family protein [Chitinophaga sp. HK235]|uniref:siphovirus Gp157 family protein n=1 Tax=Chitinophaga sp. HK235 TaxID=2952571 RepID=UPI001BAA7059|nr:siphovirus Gp157 family protein [Chitinophaga sp. HK235]
MGATREPFESAGAYQERKKSLFNIRQDHLSLLTEIEDADGLLTPELEERLRLTEDGFKEKAISYGFVIRKAEAESDTIAAEIKRLQQLKQQSDRKGELFRKMLDEGMQQFGMDKVDGDLLKIVYRRSKSLSLVDGFEDSILKYFKISYEMRPDLEAEAKESGIMDLTFNCFDIKITPNKTRISDMLKGGIEIPGASIQEKSNLQIK